MLPSAINSASISEKRNFQTFTVLRATKPRAKVKLSPMIRYSLRALAPLCLLLATGSGCARAQTTSTPATSKTEIAPVMAAPAAAESPAREVPVEPVERAKLQDTSINELSGLAASRKYPGLLWGHNDSGDVARIFAINPKGETVATVDFDGLEARDWEDIAFAGEWIYVAEIGDNFAVNENIVIYRLREPKLNPDKLNQEITLKSAQWETMTLSYPDGARNAESLAATPDGRLLIVSKDTKGSNFYQLKRPWSAGQVATLDKIFDNVQFGATGWLTKLVTGADLSPDGRELTLITYAQLYQFDLARPYDFKSLQLGKPRVRELPPLKQAESVCYSADGRGLWVSSEGKRAPLWQMGQS